MLVYHISFFISIQIVKFPQKSHAYSIIWYTVNGLKFVFYSFWKSCKTALHLTFTILAIFRKKTADAFKRPLLRVYMLFLFDRYPYLAVIAVRRVDFKVEVSRRLVL